MQLLNRRIPSKPVRPQRIRLAKKPFGKTKVQVRCDWLYQI
jgi:hypothetical protein